MSTRPKTKPLSRLKDSSKGEIKHIEIHPAKNSAGKLAFLTKVHRGHPKSVEDDAAKSGRYLGDPKAEETVHEDGHDMLDHVARSYGIKPEDDGDGDEE